MNAVESRTKGVQYLPQAVAQIPVVYNTLASRSLPAMAVDRDTSCGNVEGREKKIKVRGDRERMRGE
jgi:hypothetical protein